MDKDTPRLSYVPFFVAMGLYFLGYPTTAAITLFIMAGLGFLYGVAYVAKSM